MIEKEVCEESVVEQCAEFEVNNCEAVEEEVCKEVTRTTCTPTNRTVVDVDIGRYNYNVIIGWEVAATDAPLQRHGAALHGGGQPAVRHRGGGGVPGAARLRAGVRRTRQVSC